MDQPFRQHLIIDGAPLGELEPLIGEQAKQIKGLKIAICIFSGFNLVAGSVFGWALRMSFEPKPSLFVGNSEVVTAAEAETRARPRANREEKPEVNPASTAANEKGPPPPPLPQYVTVTMEGDPNASDNKQTSSGIQDKSRQGEGVARSDCARSDAQRAILKD